MITANNSYLCEGQQQTLSTIIADSYLWSTGENTSSIHVDSAGVYFVTVMVNGCSGSTSITLGQHSSPSVNIGNDTTICSVIPLTLHAQPGYLAYSWQDSSTATSLIVNSSGWYSVTVSNVYCSTTDSIHIIAVSCVIPSANFTASQSSVCQHACVNFNNFSLDAVSWNWNFPGATIQSSTDHNPAGICYDTVGVFPVYLVVFSTSGIANTLIRQDYITVNARPAVPTVTTNGTFLTSSFATAYQWMFNSTPVINANNQTYFAAHTGYYSVVITDANGCTAVSDSVYIGITGINNTTNESEWSVYPNPSKGIFNIHFDRHEMNHPQLEVTDITGKVLIHSQPLQSIQGTATIDLQHFSNGVYFLKITDESALTIQKLVIEK